MTEFGLAIIRETIRLTLALHRISNYIVVQITPTGIANLGWRFYLIWVVFNAIFVPVRFFLKSLSVAFIF